MEMLLQHLRTNTEIYFPLKICKNLSYVLLTISEVYCESQHEYLSFHLTPHFQQKGNTNKPEVPVLTAYKLASNIRLIITCA